MGTFDNTQFISVQMSVSKKAGMPVLCTEVIPGWLQKIRKPGCFYRRGDKWEYRGRTFNTPEGAAIYAVMSKEL